MDRDKSKRSKKTKEIAAPELPRNLADALDRIPTPAVDHKDLSALALSVLGELSGDTSKNSIAKVKALELLLKIKQDEREADPETKSDSDVLLAALIRRGK